MKYGKKYMNIEDGLKREWLITNGIGGFASSTIIGANTRKYHGLLVAPLTPPARRYLILSKVDEAIEINGESYKLYTNVCKEYISDGYKNQVSFEKNIVPNFIYEVKDTIIKKSICMEYGKNTVTILYEVKNGNYDSKLILAPIMNFRDFHTMSTNHNFNLRQRMKGNTKLKISIDGHSDFPVYLNCSEGEYIEHYNDKFKNMFYIEEEKRGFYPEEDHVVPGRYEIEIKPNEKKEITFVCSFEENIEEIDAKKVIKNEKKRIKQLVESSELVDEDTIRTEKLISKYIVASDNFIVYRQAFGLHTIIAGYPWFLDWGRDTLISFEGLLLIPKRYDIAKEVLLTMVRDVKYGLVPNGYSGYDNRPLYNSVDSSLLLFEQIKKYVDYTGDLEFVRNRLYDIMVRIIYAYMQKIDVDNNNIYLDKDYLIVSGSEETQNTWMDAKIGNYAVTPRNGKAVEVNSMWYNALKIMEELTTKLFDKKYAKQYGDMAEKCKKSFNEKFYNKRRKCLYDVIGDSKIRPNQLFSLSLSYQVINPGSEEALNIMEVVEQKLLNNYGLKSLAKGEENYVEVYEGSPVKRDMSYHQGITWPWLLGLYSDAWKNIIKATKSKKLKKELEEKYNKFVENIKDTFLKEIDEGNSIGSIPELYDSVKPCSPKGAYFQAWSVAEVFRIILKNS